MSEPTPIDKKGGTGAVTIAQRGGKRVFTFSGEIWIPTKKMLNAKVVYNKKNYTFFLSINIIFSFLFFISTKIIKSSSNLDWVWLLLPGKSEIFNCFRNIQVNRYQQAQCSIQKSVKYVVFLIIFSIKHSLFLVNSTVWNL